MAGPICDGLTQSSSWYHLSSIDTTSELIEGWSGEKDVPVCFCLPDTWAPWLRRIKLLVASFTQGFVIHVLTHNQDIITFLLEWVRWPGLDKDFLYLSLILWLPLTDATVLCLLDSSSDDLSEWVLVESSSLGLISSAFSTMCWTSCLNCISSANCWPCSASVTSMSRPALWACKSCTSKAAVCWVASPNWLCPIGWPDDQVPPSPIESSIGFWSVWDPDWSMGVWHSLLWCTTISESPMSPCVPWSRCVLDWAEVAVPLWKADGSSARLSGIQSFAKVFTATVMEAVVLIYVGSVVDLTGMLCIGGIADRDMSPDWISDMIAIVLLGPDNASGAGFFFCQASLPTGLLTSHLLWLSPDQEQGLGWSQGWHSHLERSFQWGMGQIPLD